ncbi:S-adenosyl-L-methionine-dependent methyltransferase [Naviculisporaceae sp. PSN 640]
MAPYLDPGIIHHKAMDRHTESNHAQGEAGITADFMEIREALKAVNDGRILESTSLKNAQTTDHAANVKKLPNTNGSASSSRPRTATDVPHPVNINGAETIQVPESEQVYYQQGTTFINKPTARTNGIITANGAKNATSRTRNDQIPISPSHAPRDQSIPLDRLRMLVEEIGRGVDTLSHGCGAPNTDVAQMKLTTAASELLNAVRAPSETIMGWFAQMSVVSVVNLFQHWGVFDIIPAQEGQFIPFSELAEKVRAEEALLIRLSWMLTSSSVLRFIPASNPSAGSGGLAHTPTSLMLRSQSPLASMFQLLHTNIVETSPIMPSYFDIYGRKEPTGPSYIPASYLAGQPELSYFELVNQDQEKLKSFMHAMTIAHRRTPITGMYDPEELIEFAEVMDRDSKGSKEKPPIWVDIGGSNGSVIKTFLEAYPKLKAQWCVVQDLPEVVEAAKRDAAGDEKLKGVRFLPMDFHKESPVKGALVYYLRHIVRDYSDPVVINILSNIRKSMVPLAVCKDVRRASRILISEQLMPYPAPPMFAAFKDYAMLAVGGKERSLQQFEAIAEAAGLAVTAIYRDKATPHAVIEMMVKV